MTMRLLLLLLVVGLTVSFGGREARAQDRALELAKQHFDEGQGLFAAAKYSEAAAEFQKAFDAKPFTAFLFNIAVCHERNQDIPRALEYFQRYLDSEPRSADRAAVLARMETLRRQLAPAGSQPASQPGATPAALPLLRVKGMVAIVSKPPGAAIYVDNKRRGIYARTPFHGTLPSGQHTVLIELRKYKPDSQTLVIKPEDFYHVIFSLSRDDYLGWIDVKSNVPGADVYFDDKGRGPIGRTPYSGFLKPGQHTLYIERRGYEPVSRVFQVAVAQAHDEDVQLQKVSYGWLRVTGETTRGAKVLVDGKPLSCRSTPCETELSPGNYNVEVQRKGFKSYRERLSVRQAAETHFLVRLMPRPPRTKAYINFAMSGAFLIGGIVCAVLSQSTANQVQSSTAGQPIDSGDSRFFTGRVLAITADSLFGLAAIAGGLGMYYMFRNEGPDSYGETRERQIADSAPARRRSVTLVPSLGPGGVGMAGLVRF